MSKPDHTLILSMIPDLDDADVVFAGRVVEAAYDQLTPLAREQPLTWGPDLFSSLFFGGGKAPSRKSIDGMTDSDWTRLFRFIRAAMGSFYPKHEDKTRVVGWLFETFYVKP